MKGSVCFVSETARHDQPLLDPAVRYRCAHPAEALQAEGYRVTIQSAARFFAAPCWQHDAYVFHRPRADHPRFGPTMDRLAALNRVLVADYDDLVFGAPDVAATLPAVRTGRMPLAQAVANFATCTQAMGRFDRVCVATTPLATEAAAVRPHAAVRVSPNVVPSRHRRTLSDAGLARRPRDRGRIGYFAGTGNHSHDLAAVAEMLHRVLVEDPQAGLLVMGPVQLPRALAILPNVQIAPAVPYAALPAWMAMCTTVIAPLEQTRFNLCKSRVKFLEAALSGCRLIATPIPDMVAVGPAHIRLASTPDDWYAALSAVPDAPALDRARLANLQALAEGADSAPLRQLIEA